MATLRRLQAFECIHRRRPISSSTHSRFQQPSCWLHSLLKNRPGQGLSSNSHGSIIHCEDSRDNPFGLWESLRMPFGLKKNAAQSFQRLMDGILRDVPFAFVYLDDILVASPSSQEYLQHLRQLFQLLSTNGLVINKTQCVFGSDKLDFLDIMSALTVSLHFQTG